MSRAPRPGWFEEDEEDDATLRRYAYASIADQLVSILQVRMQGLQDDPSPDRLLREAKKELSASAAEGDLDAMRYLFSLIEEVVSAYRT